MANLKDQLDALVKALQEQTEANKKAKDAREAGKREKEINNSISKLLNFGKTFENFMKPVTEFQASMTSMGRSLDGTMKNVLGGSMPLQTRMVSTMTLLRSGLEGNSASLGRFVVRAQALGENINMLATGFRDIRTSLGLTTRQLGELGTYTVDSARTYKISSDQLVKSMADLSRKMGVLGFAGAGTSMKALADAVAQTSLVAPGGIAQVLGPMMSGGIETIATAQMSGMQSFLTRLTNNQITSSREVFSAFQGFINRIDQTIKPSLAQGPQVANTLLQQLYGINFETYNTMRVMVDSFKNNPVQERIAASLDEARGLLNQIGPRLEEPLVYVASRVLTLIEIISPIFPLMISIFAGLGVMKSVQGLVYGIDKLRNITLKQILLGIRSQAAGAAAGSKAGFLTLLGPLAGILSTGIMAYQMYSESKNTLDEMNEREKRQELPDIEEINRQTQTMAIASIGNIMAASARAGIKQPGETDAQLKSLEAVKTAIEQSNVFLKNIYERSGQDRLQGGGSPLGRD